MQNFSQLPPIEPVPDTAGIQTILSQSLPEKSRLEYLDGVRGIACFYVLLYHIYCVMEFRQSWYRMPHKVQTLLSWTQFGHASVGIFIVLSGYVLMLPLARGATRNVKGGLRTFMLRRARRLLPPYFAALALSSILVGIGYVLQSRGHHLEAKMAQNFTTASVISHLLLLHNLTRETAYTINPAFWSVATEWHIYFLFPILLLPLWRRGGPALAIGGAFLVGLAPYALFHGALQDACPWYLGLFTLGMVGAVISLSNEERWANLRRRVPWFPIAVLSGMVASAMCYLVPNLAKIYWLFDIIVGLGSLCLLVACTAEHTELIQRRSVALSIFDSRFAILLGSFSYSIYLIHYPFLNIARFLLSKMELSGLQEGAMFLFIVLPVILGIAYLFHLAFERPFMPPRS